jgi:prepilin-type N-terminal cleavage/methylation domain-containing protein
MLSDDRFAPMRGTVSRTKQIAKSRGFTLVELAVVVAIIALLLVLFLPANTASIVNQRRANTTQKLANIETAIANFVVVNRRLPCPTDGSLLADSAKTALWGIEGRDAATGDCTLNITNQGNGAVPWVTLGLQLGDVTDSWDDLITYRVGFGLTRSSALDMTSCDPAGTKSETVVNAAPNINLGLCDTTTCGVGTFAAANCTAPSSFLQRKGVDVKSTAAVTVMSYLANTGAAYVLISHGENRYGAISNIGIYQATAARGIAGTTLEEPNKNLSTLTVTAVAPPAFMSATYNESDDATLYFDDIVVRPLLYSVIGRANLGPRAH